MGLSRFSYGRRDWEGTSRAVPGIRDSKRDGIRNGGLFRCVHHRFSFEVYRSGTAGDAVNVRFKSSPTDERQLSRCAFDRLLKRRWNAMMKSVNRQEKCFLEAFFFYKHTFFFNREKYNNSNKSPLFYFLIRIAFCHHQKRLTQGDT